VEFDWTVSLGSLIAGGSVVIGLFASTWKVAALVADAKGDVEALKSDMHEVKRDVERIAVMQQQLIDGKERMDRIEKRIDRMEFRQ
jgi:hypothetical protein